MVAVGRIEPEQISKRTNCRFTTPNHPSRQETMIQFGRGGRHIGALEELNSAV
jgi:hypothetical protein